MKYIFRIFTLFLFIFSCLGFSQTPVKPKFVEDSSMLGMILLNESNSLDMKNLILDYESIWKLKIVSKEIGEEATLLEIDGYKILIAILSIPIPGDEIEFAADYNYLFENGKQITSNHKGHVILSIVNSGQDPLKENILFSKLTSGILENSNSSCFYMGSRTLLIEKRFYVMNTKSMLEGELPIFNWIYFGLRQNKGKQSVYTYGLKEFGKKEMEIIKSKKSLQEISELMYNITNYVIADDVTFESGETLGLTADQKIKIKESKGEFLAERTFKIDF